MNNTLISTIRFGAVLGIALFAFVGEVFAAPTITPVSVKAFSASGTTVTIASKAATPSWTNAPVWFEYGETPTPINVVGMTTVFSKGGTFEPFEARVGDLKPGITYYFRAVATEDGVTVYSPVSSYTVPGGTTAVAGTTNTGNNTNTNTNTNTTTTNTNVVRETVVITTPAKVVTSATVVKAVEVKPVQANTTNPVTNPNSAAIIGSGDSMFPQTLIGWIGLLLALLATVVLLKMVVESFEAVHSTPAKKRSEDEEGAPAHA